MTKRDVRKCLIYSIITLVLMFIWIPILFIMGITFAIITAFTFMTAAIVSLIFYFINPEIMYGMWLSRRKYKQTRRQNRNIVIGRRIFVIIVIIGLIFGFVTYLQIINTLSS